jgi:hypothetical protein
MKVSRNKKNKRRKTRVFFDDALKDAEKDRGVSEIGGPVGPEPTRFGDWEKNGRCSDF